jgi:hypothetical protein
MAVERNVLIERPVDRFAGMRVSWGGVFAGVLAGVGTLLLLTSLGLAIGVSAVDPSQPDGSAIGTGAAVWTALTLLISLFVGGWTSTRLSMLWERTTALFEGALVWVLSMILILYLAANGIGLVASGAMSMVGQTAEAASSAIGGGVENLASGDVDQMLDRLRDPQTASQIASVTGQPREEVQSTLNSIAMDVENARDDPQRAAAAVRDRMQPMLEQAKQRAAQAAERAQPAASKTAWITFAALLLSLLAAIGGAAVGRRNASERAVEGATGR